VDEGLEEGNKAVDTAAALVRKGGDEDLLIVNIGNEDGVDEHVLEEEVPMLALKL